MKVLVGVRVAVLGPLPLTPAEMAGARCPSGSPGERPSLSMGEERSSTLVIGRARACRRRTRA